ncbi:class I SAM-dependent methyltransferase [Synechococcus sp. UW179A]|uniref:class I SAM-dependent methyltransferase n=1 Tax=Synechococcus sp. UW179A TaxID=2575510 RepID=UPI000E0ECA6A|nr:class I SAM-dependent methyltransferase [Synechococcus sp. UW179A]
MDQKTIQELSSTGRHQECLQACQQLLQSEPENSFPWKYAGKSLLALGQFEKAQQCLTKAHQLNNKDPETLKDIGNIFNALQNDAEAIRLYKAALSIDQNYAPAINNLGLIAKRQGSLTAAEQLIKRACDLDRSFAPYYINLGGIYKDLGNLDQALASTLKSLELKPDNPTALMNLGIIYKDLGNLDQALASTLKSKELKPDNPDAHMNLGGIYKDLGNLDQALASTLKSLELKPDNPTALMNLGIIYKDLGNLDQALASTLKSKELKPDNPDAHMNLGGIYKDLGNLDQALASTLKSLELKPDNPTALMNLGIIYKDLGNLDQALASTLKSLELKPDNPGAVSNLNTFIDQLNISPSNAHNVTRAYELLLNQTDISHQKLSQIFLQTFLPTIQKASASDPIISNENQSLKALAADWRFLKSLSLMVPPVSEAEGFFTRLRKELLALTIQMGTVPEQLRRLTKSLAAQCFLNEYVYTSSQEEDDSIAQLIEAAAHNQENTNRHLAIIGCYKAIYTTGISTEFINNYPTPDDSSKELITAQFKEPLLEQEIKTSLQEKRNVSDTISQQVQAMYQESPYPRFKFADYTSSKLAKPILKAVELETSRKDLSFSEELKSLTAAPKVLIAGCGTGNQVINASRYKNAQITAIDLSSSSLAYASRKTNEYEMNNVTFKQMDLLNVTQLGDIFDIIECSGVLHHMENPSKGLSALLQQLKPGGYIKLGLYSEIARKVIVEARETIKTLKIDSTPEEIRRFRKQVLDGEINEILDLPKFGRDFYSLSECRDLCFHVQEHRFTTDSLKKLLDSHGLTFCGFIVTEQIKKIYQEQYPEDIDMTSLPNWGKFEEKCLSTFTGMYQFWAHKPS